MLHKNVLLRTWNCIEYTTVKSPNDMQYMRCLFKFFNTVPVFFKQNICNIPQRNAPK
jgi:hypothetical protein